jgi:ribosomal protein L37E
MATMRCENPHDAANDSLNEAPPRCNGCGHKVPDYPAWECPDCGFLCSECVTMKAGRRVCTHCGLPVKRERDEDSC